MLYINKKNKLVLHASMGELHRHTLRERGHKREYMPHDSAYTKLNRETNQCLWSQNSGSLEGGG